MDKKEKSARLKNHVAYFGFADLIRETSLNAIGNDLSVSDVISVLDRIKVELLQQEVIVTIEETQNDPDEEQEDDDIKEMAIGVPQEGLASVPSVDPTKLMEEATRGMYN